ncbi:MAG: M28 family peptidase [Armatimonadetes bacterium]|nr:M28 family peptidase [Armatimonadota bacterium]
MSLLLSLLAATVMGQDPVKPRPTFDQAAAWKVLTTQCDFGPRVPGTPGHLKCRDYLVETFKKSCDSVKTVELTHNWSKGKKVTMWNIVATQNWEKATTRVVLLAHWDTRPTADQEESAAKRKQPILGANDGASGVAVLAELARAADFPKSVGIAYILTDGEDLGPSLEEMFLGAKHIVQSRANTKQYFGDNVPNYGILLDMIGDKSLRIPVEPNSAYYAPKLMGAFYDHAAKIGLGSTFPKVYGPSIEDDHICLNDAGIPVIDLIDFDYEPWHTLGDTVDKCSAESLGKVGKMLHSWLKLDPPFSGPVK